VADSADKVEALASDIDMHLVNTLLPTKMFTLFTERAGNRKPFVIRRTCDRSIVA
jgi:hypothetical protein